MILRVIRESKGGWVPGEIKKQKVRTMRQCDERVKGREREGGMHKSSFTFTWFMEEEEECDEYDDGEENEEGEGERKKEKR